MAPQLATVDVALNLIDAFRLLISSKMSLIHANLSKFHRSGHVVLSSKLKNQTRTEKRFHNICATKMSFELSWYHISSPLLKWDVGRMTF